MKVVVLNTVLSNTGDAAIYQSIVHSLVGEGVASTDSVVAFDSSADAAGRLYPAWKIEQQLTRSSGRRGISTRVRNAIRTATVEILATVPAMAVPFVRIAAPWSELARSLRTLLAAEIVVSSGGTYLVDHYRFGHRVAELRLAAALGKPVFLWTQSLGPFRQGRALRNLRRLAPVVDGVFFRDERSRQAWRAKAELPEISAVVPDSVFALMPPAGADAHPRQAKPRVVFSVRRWDSAVEGGPFGFEQYASAMRAAAESFISAGWECIAMSTCQGVEEYHIDDSATARQVFDGLDVLIDANFHTPSDLLSRIGQADLLIATRMHMGIIGLLAGTPTVAIAYETKSLELFKSLGFPDAVTAIEKTDRRWAEDQLSPTAAAARAVVLSAAQRAELREAAAAPAAKLARAQPVEVGV